MFIKRRHEIEGLNYIHWEDEENLKGHLANKECLNKIHAVTSSAYSVIDLNTIPGLLIHPNDMPEDSFCRKKIAADFEFYKSNNIPDCNTNEMMKIYQNDYWRVFFKHRSTTATPYLGKKEDYIFAYQITSCEESDIQRIKKLFTSLYQNYGDPVLAVVSDFCINNHGKLTGDIKYSIYLVHSGDASKINLSLFWDRYVDMLGI